MKMNSFENVLGELFKQSLIEHLEQKDLIFDEEITLDNYENRKFTAWSIKNLKWSNIEGAVKQLFKTIDDYIDETYKGQNKKIRFNLKNCEYLTNNDNFERLFRTLVLFKLEECEG